MDALPSASSNWALKKESVQQQDHYRVTRQLKLPFLSRAWKDKDTCKPRQTQNFLDCKCEDDVAHRGMQAFLITTRHILISTLLFQNTNLWVVLNNNWQKVCCGLVSQANKEMLLSKRSRAEPSRESEKKKTLICGFVSWWLHSKEQKEPRGKVLHRWILWELSWGTGSSCLVVWPCMHAHVCVCVYLKTMFIHIPAANEAESHRRAECFIWSSRCSQEWNCRNEL